MQSMKMKRSFKFLITLFLFVGVSLGSTGVAQAQSASLSLNKPYNDVTWLMSHNSFATSVPEGATSVATDANHIISDQALSVARQFGDGVRAFKLPIHPYKEVTAYAIEALSAKLATATDLLRAKNLELKDKDCDKLKKLGSVICGTKIQSYSCSVPYTTVCFKKGSWGVKKPYKCTKNEKATCYKTVNKYCSTPVGTVASKACEVAVDTLNGGIAALNRTIEELKTKIASFGSPVASVEPWVCHGISKGDWDSTGKTIVNAMHKAGKFDEVVGKALDVLGVEIPFLPCLVDLRRQPLTDALAIYKTLLHGAPTEIISFYLQTEDDPSADQMVEDFETMGLAGIALAHAPGAPWPTLAKMISQDKRVVVFANNAGKLTSPTSWYQSFGDNIFTTPWQYPVTADHKTPMAGQLAPGLKDLLDLSKSCAAKDDDAYKARADGNRLFLVQHMITFQSFLPPIIFSGAPIGASAANVPLVAQRRLNGCWRERDAKPNFLLVDFYNLPAVAGTKAPNTLIQLVADFNLLESPMVLPSK